MHVCLVIDRAVPVVNYGGTERVVTWLTKELANLGCSVTIIAPSIGIELRTISKAIIAKTATEAKAAIPKDIDIAHFHGWVPDEIDQHPNWVYTLHGNATDTRLLPLRTICVSQNHALRHGKSVFVYNGVSLNESSYPKPKKNSSFLFFSKIKSRAKGITEALRLASKYDFKLIAAGGSRHHIPSIYWYARSFRSGCQFLGEVSGRTKFETFASARALIFPIAWDEPFGLVLIESMLAGTPVIAKNRGSVSEIVKLGSGRVYQTDQEFEEAINTISEIAPEQTIEYARSRFTSTIMANAYLSLYENVLSSRTIQW